MKGRSGGYPTVEVRSKINSVLLNTSMKVWIVFTSSFFVVVGCERVWTKVDR